MKKEVKKEWKAVTELVHGTSFKNRQVCKVCSNSFNKKLLKKTFLQLKYLNDNKVIWQANFPWNGGIEGLFELSYFEWACDTCLENNNAIGANIDKQTYCDYPPYLAYYDKKRECEKCGKNYIFKKEEQKYWYENLGFWVQSKPKNCISCRKTIRYNRDLNTELSKLLKEDEKKLNSKKLFRIAEIYNEIDKEEKMRKYTTIANKRLVQENRN